MSKVLKGPDIPIVTASNQRHRGTTGSCSASFVKVDFPLNELTFQWEAGSRPSINRLMELGYRSHILLEKLLLSTPTEAETTAVVLGATILDSRGVEQGPLQWRVKLRSTFWSPGLQRVAEERQGILQCLLEEECKVSPIGDGVGRHVVNWCFTVMLP